MLIIPSSERGYRKGNTNELKKKNTEQSILDPVRIIVIVLLLLLIFKKLNNTVIDGNK